MVRAWIPALEDGDGGKGDVFAAYGALRDLRQLVIVHGLPSDEDGAEVCADHMPLRSLVWRRLLDVGESSTTLEDYEQLVQCAASSFDADIRNDTFRTFRGDTKFAERVPEDKLVRFLNAFFNGMRQDEETGVQGHSLPHIRYVQGMNVLCAPLLFVMPESDAYRTFRHLIRSHCPEYIARNLEGVETGCRLVDKCLEAVDPELFCHLNSHSVTARIYAYPLILSLFACHPPLAELLRVWDVLFAIGVHFVVLLAVAHTLLLRDQLLKQDKGLTKILSAGPLQSDPLIALALQLLHRLPDKLVEEICRHPVTNPDSLDSLPISRRILSSIKAHMAQSSFEGKSEACASSSQKTPATSSNPQLIRPLGEVSNDDEERAKHKFKSTRSSSGGKRYAHDRTRRRV